MVASLLKVISSGIQDERLDFTPTLYPFYKVWRKTGRFTTQWVRLEFESIPAFGSTASFRLLRKGHLISRLVLVATLPDLYQVQRRAAVANGGVPAFPRFGWTNSLGHALVQQATLDIAASRVETLDSRLLEILDEFYTPLEKVPIVNRMIARKDSGFSETSFGWPEVEGATEPVHQTVAVPLPFWFARGDPASAFPIDAVSVDEVRCSITFRGVNGLYSTPTLRQGAGAATADGSSLWPLEGSRFYAEDPSQAVAPIPLSDAAGVIQMPTTLRLGECYLMAEYVYLDQNEANRFRIADLQVPMVQHVAVPPYDSRGLLNGRIRMEIPNPTRDLFFMCNPYEAPSYNAHFLATRDLTGTAATLPDASQLPWWPDAVGLREDRPSLTLRPAYALSDSEPLAGYALEYQGSLVRFRTEAAGLFRSVIPTQEMRKAPWHHRYYYHFPMGILNGRTPVSEPFGEANLDKIAVRELLLNFRSPYGALTNLEVKRCVVYVYAECYNILRVYGGRAGLLFA